MPASRKSSTRIVGIYQDGTTFRLVVLDAGRRVARRYQTLAEAKAEALRFSRRAVQAGSMTLTEALDAWEVARRADGAQQSSLIAMRARVESVFPNLSVAIRSLTPAALRSAFRDYERRPVRCKGRSDLPAVSTRRNARQACGALWAWLLEEKHVSGENPFPALEVKGVARRGKKQLRFGQAYAWEAQASRLAKDGDPLALAALTVFTLGLRAGETVRLRVGDMDEVADPRMPTGRLHLIYVGKAKTMAGRRTAPVPDHLWELLQKQAAGRHPESFIFASHGESGHLTEHALRLRVMEICRLAQVPEVTTHALRGSCATILREKAAELSTIAKFLGHAGPGVTERHYIADGATPVNPN